MALGPLIAGVIVDHVGWRWIFLLPVPVSLVTLVFAARLLADSRAPGTRRLDWPGQLTAAVAITALVYRVIEGGAEGFTAPRAPASLALAAVSAAAFVEVERRSDSPMLELSLFRSAAFTASTLVAMAGFPGLIGFFFVLSLYLGLVQRLDTLHAGVRMVLVNIVSMVLGVVMGRVMRHLSARVLITAGLLITAAALLSLPAAGQDPHPPPRVPLTRRAAVRRPVGGVRPLPRCRSCRPRPGARRSTCRRGPCGGESGCGPCSGTGRPPEGSQACAGERLVLVDGAARPGPYGRG
ncbi:MFS transporter [Streptomyces sp. GC420]|uniref:MFS transporter n=1 Tax=Streptomyces sp. GC420 TaxID=2697568 RepID=UPI0028BE586A|nr:MFS transporter [Streptomyces sp. GC420]